MSTGNDPVRLIADPGCPESQRALLQHGVDIAPPRDAEARVWTALAGALGGAAVASGARPTRRRRRHDAAANVEDGLMSVKIVALAAGLTALVRAGYSPSSSRPAHSAASRGVAGRRGARGRAPPAPRAAPSRRAARARRAGPTERAPPAPPRRRNRTRTGPPIARRGGSARRRR